MCKTTQIKMHSSVINYGNAVFFKRNKQAVIKIWKKNYYSFDL